MLKRAEKIPYVNRPAAAFIKAPCGRRSFGFRVRFIACLVALAALHLYGANGTAYYFDNNGTTSGFGTASGTFNENGTYWSTSSGGTATPVAFPSSAQMTFGSTGTDFAGNSFTINLNSNSWDGLVINSTNATVLLNGTDNAFLQDDQTWTVAGGSTLNEAVSWSSRGLNTNGRNLTLASSGSGNATINFNSAVGINDNSGGHTITQNGSNLVVYLNASGAGSAQGTERQMSYNLVNGTLNFHNNNSFDHMRSADAAKFIISGGTINNTSGSAMTLDLNNGTGGPGSYSIGGSFTFTGTNNLNFGNFAVALTATPTITVSNNWLYIGSVISGGYGITKAGNGTLKLTGANTYTGTTTVSAGTLVINGPAFDTAARTYTISSGATMNIDSGTTAANGTTTINGSGTLYVTGLWKNDTPNNPHGTGRNITMALGSGGLINVAASGTLCNGGWSNITWTGSPGNLADLNVDGTFDLWDGNTVQVDALTGGGTVIKGMGGGTTVVLTVGQDNGSGTFSGTISNGTGTASLTKTGSGAQTLSGANTYTGTTTLSAGTLNINNASAIGTGTFTISGGTIDNTSAGDIAMTTNNPQNWNGDFTFTGTNNLNLGTGAVSLSASRIVTISTLGSNLTVGGIISGSGKSLTLAGSGSLTLSGVNTYSGGTTISAHDTIFANNSSALGSGAVSLTASAAPYTDLSLGNGVNVANALTMNSTSAGTLRSSLAVPYGSTATYSGAITLAGDYYTGFYAFGTMTVSGTIGTSAYTGTLRLRGSGAGTLGAAAVVSIPNADVQITDGGTWTISSTGNTWGATNIVSGTLMLGINSALPSATVVTMGQGGNYTATLDLNGKNQTIAGLTETSGNTGGANALTVTNTGAAATLTINNSSNYQYDSLITNGTNALNIVKTGSGTLTLSNDNTYTGTTTINGGTLNITNTSGSATGTGAITVGSGGTLGGTGEATGAVTVQSGGTLSPGTSGVGQLKINGNLAMNSGSTFSVTVSGPAADRVFDTGTVNLGSATLSVTVLITPVPGQTYTIIDNDAADAITGTFNGQAEGSTITVASGTFRISYVGGTGNDVTLTCVTSPSLDDYSKWSYSAPISLNTTASGANVSSNQVKFPALVRLNPGTFWGFANTNTGGSDIRFAKTDGTHMAYQIDKWVNHAGNNDTAWIWVKVDTVYGNNMTQSFRMYWGNSAAVDSSSGPAVFDTTNGFLGVWHLQDVSSVTDATINNKTGTPTAVTNVPGIIGSASAFNGTNSTISIPVTALSHLTTSCTFSFWEYGDASQPLCASNFYGQDGSGNRVINAHVPCNCSPGCIFWDAGNSGATYDRIQQSVSTSSQIKGQWNLWTFVRGPAAGSMVIYYNGTQFKTGGSYTYGMTGITSFAIGSGIGTFYYFGYMDEFVAANVVRSADWITLCYQNQQANQTLVTILEDYSKWAYSRNITINTTTSGAGVATSQINFPMLVRLTSGNFTFTQARDTGQDMRFAKSDGTHFSYQIDSWDRQNQNAAVWVKVDTVFGNNSSQYFTMYWGNASAASASNGPAVFDTANNFLGVWHLNTAGAGKRPDATYFNDSAKTINGTAFTQGGLIGGCDTFITGSAQYDSIANTANSINLLDKSFTVSAWCKLVTTAANRYALGQGKAVNDSGLHFGYRQSTGKYTLAFYGDDLDQAAAYAGGTSWHLIAASYNTADKKQTLYYDGVLDNTKTAAHNYGGVGAFFIGKGFGADYFDGNIDEAVVADTVRSADWIKLCYYNQQANQTVTDAEDYSKWKYSKNINLNTTASGANVMGNVTQFPVLVRLTSSNFTFSQARDSGQDLRFAKSSGVHLPYDVEPWDRVNQNAAIWVKADTVYGNNGTQYFTMYWGNASASSTANSDVVFDSANGFVGVWHLDEGGTGTRYNDASTNLYSGTTHNYTGIESGTALIGNGDSIGATDGHNRYIDVGSIPAPSAITLSGWVKLSNYANTYGRIIGKQWNTKVSPWQSYTLETDASNPSKLELSLAISGAQQFAISNSTIPLNVWTYATGTYDGTTLKTYLNGNPAATVTAPGSIGASTPLTTIGMNDSSTAERLNGVLDEIRMEKIARDSNWIKLCYQNQQANQTLVDFDDYSKWAFSRNITINTSGITTTNLINFPLLVRLTSANFDFSQTQSTGADIRFSKANGTHLKYQVERWDKSGQHGELWAKVDTVSANNSTQYIKMYWGNSYATTRSDSNAVFDTANNFKYVWHLDEAGNNNAGNYKDATANANNGTGTGTPVQAAGVIGNGQTFSGANFISTANNIGITGTVQRTLSAWVNFNNTSSPILGWGTGACTGNKFYSFFWTTQYKVWGCGSGDYSAGTADTSGNWVYTTATYDGTKSHLFANGVEVGAGNTFAYTTADTIGQIGKAFGGTSYYCKGTIDEARIEDTARSADWIRMCYETQRPTSLTQVTSDSADAFRPLSIKRYNGGADSIYVGTTRWALKFNAKTGGGGPAFLAADTSSTNQISNNLFYFLYNGAGSDSSTGTLSLLDSSIVFTRIRQQKTISSQPFTIDYTVLGSGKMYARVTTFVPAGSSNLGTGLEFRVENNSAANYDNVQYGTSASNCQAVLHIDSSSGKYDLLMAPYDLWTQADLVTIPSAKAIGLKSSTWTLAAGSRQTWNFMIDFSHKALHDSASAWKYINDYRLSDTLGWYTGTPLLEKAWEDRLYGHWKLDEQGGDTAYDASVSAQGGFGNIRGGGKWRTGMWGNADSVDGNDSIIVHPGSTACFNGENSSAGFTILGWVKPTVALTSSSVLFQQMVGNSGYQLTGATGNGGQLQLTLGNTSGTIYLPGKTVLNPGQWYHVGAAFTGSRDTMKLYVNGVPDTVRVGTGWNSYPSSNSDSVDMGNLFNGELDDMRFYGEGLSDQQVKAIYLKGFSPDRGMYSVRADNNSQIQCAIHGANTVRTLPVFQIQNYWLTGLPSYVYATENSTDTAKLTSGTDYYAALDANVKTLTVGFNREFPYNSTIYIGNTTGGQSVLTTMPQMYWGQATVGTAPHVWVKNFSGNYFGSSTASNFFFDWKMTYGNFTNTKNGELWYYASSSKTPNVRLDTTSTADTNVIPLYGGNSEDFGNMNLCFTAGGCPISSRDVNASYTYSIAESSGVRILLNVNTRNVLSTNSYKIDTRWAIYPTGQIWRWDSISYLSNTIDKVYGYDFMLDTLVAIASTTTIPTPKSKLRAGFHSAWLPDYVVAVLGCKNNDTSALSINAGIYKQPYDGANDTMSHLGWDSAAGVQFDDQSDHPNPKWDKIPFEIAAYLDLQRTSVTAGYIDSIADAVQHFPNPALTMTTGSLNKHSWGDLDTNGFSEGEGAYVVGATNNTVQFTLLAAAADSSCRVNPAFRITGYTGATAPPYVIVGGTLLTSGYGYNEYLNKAKQEAIVQLNQTICSNTTVFISYDKTLAVTMDRFEAAPGDRNDTLQWRTESESQNLGFYLYRRVKPSFLDSLIAKGAAAPKADTSADAPDDAAYCLGKKLVTQDDTVFRLVNTNGMVMGAPQGKSYGPRVYRFVDYRVYNGIRYEYSLEAVDFNQSRSLYKDYANVMPARFVPKEFELHGNFPNPFRAVTMIRFALPVKTKVDLYVFSLEGRLVRRLVDHDMRSAGLYKVGWDGKDDHARPVASGPYIYRMSTSAFVKARVMILAR
jgi:autotransporter-associated beta strand protein